MKRLFATAVLVCAIVAGAYAVDDNQPQPKVTVQKGATAIPGRNTGDLSPRPAISGGAQRAVSRESIEYLRKLRKNTPFGTKVFDLAALRAGMGSRREPSIQGIKLVRAKVGDIPCEWVLSPGADPDLRLLYLHGGGFVSGSGAFYLTLAAHLSAAAKCAVLLPDYRLAPEHPFPAGLEDCIRAHEWMIANGPSGAAPCRATFIAGDSAGGSLTLAALLALRDRRQALPAGGIALSPTTDLTLASESLRTVNDPIISARTMPVFRDLYLGKTDPRNPLASPVFGDYRGIPPLLIQVGEHEMLRDDSIRVAKKARSDGIAVKLEVWPGMFHVFQSHEPLLPEGQEAIDHAAEFIRSLSPRAAKTVRVVLPQQADVVVRNIAGVLARQVMQRCDAHVVDDGDAPLKIELAIAPGIGREGFRIEDRPGGGVRIVGNDTRGLLFGVGKLLRASRYHQGGFIPGPWRGTSLPEKTVRGIYFATHFHNFYHDAPIAEVERYVEDLGLWGFNTLIVWYDMHHFNGFDSPEAADLRMRLKAICGAAHRVGLDVGLVNIANEGYANSPTALRADPKGMRGADFRTDICTSKPEGRQYVLNNLARQYDWARDLKPKWVVIWPYDSGGCGCAKCQPWGHGGYLRIAEAEARLARSKFPGVRVVLSTWFFDRQERTGLARAFATRPDWVDYLLVERGDPTGTVGAPWAHHSPGGIPLVGFPEITMAGNVWSWGGSGANVLPTRYQREWNDIKTQWQGGFPYSEGIYDDIHKALFAGFYWKADTTADETLKEYVAFEFSPDVVDLVLPAIRLIEENVTPQKGIASSLKARELLEQADARLSSEARRAWRWRILLLRARINAQLYLNGGVARGRVLHDACEEITAIYHAQHADGYVKPPQIDPTERR